ncbi:hypothetical protein BFR40_00200 [Brochothrix thermosphacta]|uniref:hypothetical protein n=1 Tax=Brochothrix thermosphacta TaxID=2756 RepID=UPI00083F66B3|nr:hypothetical protein [Brochothrix thermosphacta]ODJ53072.1 hypothetical protein BFR40_00200 [Brochothrix thermosphacta]
MKELIAENNNKRHALTKQNQLYYEDILLYLRLRGGWRYQEQQIEEILLVILDDLLSAQADNITALDYFGKHPQQLADAMLVEIKPSTWSERLSAFLYAYAPFLLFFILMTFIQTEPAINFGKLLFVLVTLVLLISILLLLIRRSIYSKKIKFEKVVLYGVSSLRMMGLLLAMIYFPPFFVVSFNNLTSILIISLILVIGCYFSFNNKESLLRPYFPLLLLGCLLAYAYRVSMLQGWLDSLTGTIITIGLLVIGLILSTKTVLRKK